jgi:AAA15 family ATPase/GTPase
MLLELKIKNFKSIKDEVVLSTQVREKGNLNIINTKNNLFPKVLKSMLLTGPNASGKSNVLEAVYLIVYFIENNLKLSPGDEIKLYNPFRLDDLTLNNPSEFEISLLIEDLVYTYGFSINRKQIVNEYLYFYKNKTKVMVFERNYQTFKFNNTSLKELKKEQEQLKERTSENKLYLSVSANWNFKISEKVIKFIGQKIYFLNNFKDSNIPILKRIKESVEYKNKLLSSLKAVDFGIKDLNVLEEDIPEKFIEKILNDIEIPKNKTREEIIESLKNSKAFKLEVLHTYLSKNKQMSVYFPQQEESLGTNRFFEIMGEIINVIDNNGVLIIDELEVNLHPFLTNYINLYINGSKNKGAQVIYTTHCYSLLDVNESKLSHDQIWFTQRKEDQSTDLFSLSQYSERKDKNLNIMKRYFEGRYGAKPFVDFGDVEK